MKKLMIALLAAVVCNSLMAGVLIYDYSASFKRLDIGAIKKVSWKDDDGDKHSDKLDTVKVTSDKFTGYMVIEACINCGGEMEASADNGNTEPGNIAVVYVTRKGSSKQAGKYKNAVHRAIGRFYADMFGKAGINHDEEAVNIKKGATEAAGFLSYYLDSYGYIDDKGTSHPGFMGNGNIDGNAIFDWWQENPYELPADFDTVDHAGFGKMVVQPVEEECGPEEYCMMVKNLSGSMLAGFQYYGKCGAVLLDICNPVDNEAKYAPIAGTFTLKLNNKLTFTKDVFNYADFLEADEALLKKMGAYDGKAAADKFFDNVEDDEVEFEIEPKATSIWHEADEGDDDEGDDDEGEI